MPLKEGKKIRRLEDERVVEMHMDLCMCTEFWAKRMNWSLTELAEGTEKQYLDRIYRIRRMFQEFFVFPEERQKSIIPFGEGGDILVQSSV